MLVTAREDSKTGNTVVDVYFPISSWTTPEGFKGSREEGLYLITKQVVQSLLECGDVQQGIVISAIQDVLNSRAS